MSELKQIKMLGDGILVKKPKIAEKVGGLILTEEMQSSLLDMHKGEVVAVGSGSAQEMEIEVGDIAHIVKGPQYAVIMLDNEEYWVLAQHNVLYVKRS